MLTKDNQKPELLFQIYKAPDGNIFIAGSEELMEKTVEVVKILASLQMAMIKKLEKEEPESRIMKPRILLRPV